MPKLTVYDAVETLKPNISPNPARGMFGGPLGAYEVNPTMAGGVNPTVQKIVRHYPLSWYSLRNLTTVKRLQGPKTLKPSPSTPLHPPRYLEK